MIRIVDENRIWPGVSAERETLIDINACTAGHGTLPSYRCRRMDLNDIRDRHVTCQGKKLSCGK
jgi:hypothetical protein